MLKHLVLTVTLAAAAAVFGADEPPKSVDPRLKMELFAEHPQIVTPTGLDVDYRGRVFAIESNTHFPPAGYKGHPTDRVLVMSDSDDDGRADKIVVFTDGLTHSMSLLVRPLWFPVLATAGKPAPKQSIYIATRKEIRLFHDDNGDDVADRNDLIMHLETPGNYPHNGLAGLALDGLGWLYFGFGENLGADYKIIGSDGTTLAGGGEGGNIYRCRLDGSHLSQISTGFWNPHANAFDAFGHLFSVDNDPDSRPPCRLIHVIPDGDYGYRFRNGRKGLHPFTSWDGEVPGTLPMVGGTGEAPSGILAYESNGLPEEYWGNLLVTSWGDHRIDRFRLQPRGTSFTALAEPVITGGENFRPVGLATAPDGSLYCTDWVLRDYKVHGHGRIWRIRPVAPRTAPVVNLAEIPVMDPDQYAAFLDSPRRDVRRMAAHHFRKVEPTTPRGQVEIFWSRRVEEVITGQGPQDPLVGFVEMLPNLADETEKPPFARGSRKARANAREMLGEMLSQGREPRQPDQDLLLPMLTRETFVPEGDLVKLVASVDDPFLHSIAVTMLARQFTQDDFAIYLTPGSNASIPSRIAMLLAARKQKPKEDSLLRIALHDHDADVRRIAVQWVAEEKLKDLRPEVEEVLSSPGMTAELFLATLAALQMLDGGNPADFDKMPPETYVVPLIKDQQRPAAVRAQALRLVSPTDKVFDTALLTMLSKADDKELRLEAVRTLQGANPQISAPLLREIASDDKRELTERAEAIVGLSGLIKEEPPGGPGRKVIADLLKSGKVPPQLQREALRAVRGLLADNALKTAVAAVADSLKNATDEGTAVEAADQISLLFAEEKLEAPESIRSWVSKKPKTSEQWLAQLNRGRDVDAAAGRRTFYHPLGAGCFKCHRIEGRGGRVGPDLSRTVGTMNRVQLIQSILEPSREIAPQYVAWNFVLHDGRIVTGMIVHENEGKTIVGKSDGNTIELKTADIEERTPQRISVMPDKLTDRLTLQELRDLIAFLDAQR